MSVLIGWHFLSQKIQHLFAGCNVNMESDFVNLLRREIYDILSTKKSRKIMKKYICGFINMK